MTPLDTMISADTRREDRLPPNQVQTRKWPVLHWGEVPTFDPATWDLTIFPTPFVDAVTIFTWPEFTALPRMNVFGDMHCVTRWSLLDNLWEGVPTKELLKHATAAERMNKHVAISGVMLVFAYWIGRVRNGCSRARYP